MRFRSQTRHVVDHLYVILHQLGDQNLQVAHCEHVGWGWETQLLVLRINEVPLQISCQIKHKGRKKGHVKCNDIRCCTLFLHLGQFCCMKHRSEALGEVHPVTLLFVWAGYGTECVHCLTKYGSASGLWLVERTDVVPIKGKGSLIPVRILDFRNGDNTYYSEPFWIPPKDCWSDREVADPSVVVVVVAGGGGGGGGGSSVEDYDGYVQILTCPLTLWYH